MGRSFRHGSSSGSFCETKTTPSPEAAKELLGMLLNMSQTTSLSHLSLNAAQALLQRASSADMLQDFVLQTEDENGYTPLHSAVMEGNLLSVLCLLRLSEKRLTHRPMNLLADQVSNAAPVLRSMVQAVDKEGLAPLELLGQLQRSSLRECRESLVGVTVDVIQQEHAQDEQQDEQNELALLDDFVHVLQEDGDDNDAPLSSACEVLTFGRANHCALGIPRSEGTSYPQRVQAFSLDTVGIDGAAVVVAAATHHTLVVTRDGSLYACGLGKGGRLGLGEERHCPLPTRVMGSLSKRQVLHAAAAENHSLCVTRDGNVYAWGSNRFGQLGCGSKGCFLPKRVDVPSNCIAVAAGEKHSVALTGDGQVYTWGDNTAGQLGRRTGTGVQRVDALWNANPRKVAISIAASEHSSLILTAPAAMGLPVNSVYSWGHGNHVPIKVNFTNRSTQERRQANPVAIASAKYHNAAVMADGQVYTWGLHAEPLGQKSKQRGNGSSMVIASPQLVTGMLPKNGGGFAVAVSASEHHTAIVTDCGHLYTWGATYGKDVLGHEGVRWQPDPKKVSGVHRAVGVAAAKEHNVLLVGTSYPPIPTAVEPSLEIMAARQVAKHVDLFNVIPILVTAGRSDCIFLQEYCMDFVRLNLDGVLTLGRKSEMDCYLNEQLANGIHTLEQVDRDMACHPLFHDVLCAGSISPLQEADTARWMEACTSLLERLPVSTHVKYRLTTTRDMPTRRALRGSRALSFHDADHGDLQHCFSECSERCLMLTRNMEIKTSEAARAKADSLSKEVRSVRKRLNQISKLQGAEGLLTDDQQRKVERKSLLELDLAILEPALDSVEKKLREWTIENEEEPPLSPSLDSVQTVENDAKESDANDSVDETPATKPKVFRCEVCSISCSDSNSLALHKNGRKHRNRVAQTKEEEQKKAAASIMEEKRRQSLLSGVERPSPAVATVPKSCPWNRDAPSVQPSYKLPPPPHFPSLAESASKTPAKSSGLKSSSSRERKKTPNAPTTPPVFNLLNPGPLPAVKSPPWSSPSARMHIMASDTGVSVENKKTYSLGDFLHSSSPPAAKSSPAPWSASSKTISSEKTSPAAKSQSFLAIQQEEETFRDKRDRSNSVEGKWFIERRERAGSISAIQEAEEKERQHLLFVEEQKRIEEQIEREKRQQEEKKKARGRKPKKQNRSSGGSQARKGSKKATQSDKNNDVKRDRKRRPRNRRKSNAGDTESVQPKPKIDSSPNGTDRINE